MSFSHLFSVDTDTSSAVSVRASFHCSVNKVAHIVDHFVHIVQSGLVTSCMDFIPSFL